jgi:hypothetical protein
MPMYARRTAVHAALVAVPVLTLVACADGGFTAPTRDIAPRAAVIIGPPPPSDLVVDSVNVSTAPVPLTNGGASVPVDVFYTSPNPGDAFTATLNCEGSTATASGSNGVGSGSCTFSAPGVYTVSVSVTDASGATVTTTSSSYAVVYDAGAGFVTGGGWVNVAAGSYAANPSLTGRANVGFVSKYLKGASVPTGQTEFQFQAGSLNFHSTSYEWLVVAGFRAQYKGVGTINHQSGYGFMLTAIDGKLEGTRQDRFRIKIWELNGGAIVFDNQMGEGDGADPSTALLSGAISIKK